MLRSSTSSGSLEVLGLSSNNIGDEGAKALAASVAASGSLAELFLGQNQLGDAGAKELARAISASGSLTLKTLRVGSLNGHAELVAACKSKGVELKSI